MTLCSTPNLMRVTGNLEGVWQHNGVNGVTHDWPVFCMTAEPRLFLRQGFDTLDNVMGNPAGAQMTAFPGWVQHQQMVAKQGGELCFQR